MVTRTVNQRIPSRILDKQRVAPSRGNASGARRRAAQDGNLTQEQLRGLYRLAAGMDVVVPRVKGLRSVKPSTKGIAARALVARWQDVADAARKAMDLSLQYSAFDLPPGCEELLHRLQSAVATILQRVMSEMQANDSLIREAVTERAAQSQARGYEGTPVLPNSDPDLDGVLQSKYNALAGDSAVSVSMRAFDAEGLALRAAASARAAELATAFELGTPQDKARAAFGLPAVEKRDASLYEMFGDFSHSGLTVRVGDGSGDGRKSLYERHLQQVKKTALGGK